ncbi:MAG: RagB/SusD family nutrient uptake outer membrane protein [Bacteroidales bacterium]|nr:RagB/SusD family nutrient uptake outer membrane protein [Bacteroidales bacterium]MDY2916889.1 RagB/SusD family nutrient uptake outer membrane protein [Muribaculaceae bacterium]
MKLHNTIAAAAALATMALTGCTNLDETVYDQVMSDNYYNTKMDVIRAVNRPFEHMFWSIQTRMALNELTADQIITPTRDSWWYDGGQWERLHYHDFNAETTYLQAEWEGSFKGIMFSNYVTEDLERLDGSKLGFTEAEWESMKCQCRVMRAYCYWRLLDMFRNVPSYPSTDPNSSDGNQLTPQQTFDLIESELLACLPVIETKQGSGGNQGLQGQFNKAAVAALLVRLYMNAEVYIGQDRYADAARYAQAIVDGEYGYYKVADRWDEAFDWNNETSDEVIFGFWSSYAYAGSAWLYKGDTYWWSVPQQMEYYVNDSKSDGGDHNCKYACTPSYDLNGQLYNYTLGMTVQKFRTYPSDVRLKLYKNLGNSTREGMFVFGSLDVVKDGKRGKMTDPTGSYELYIRDAVGQFKGLRPNQWPANKRSNLRSGDHQSGYHFVKYPLYPSDEQGHMESDFVEIRLPEVIYSLAECRFRAGSVNEAGRLLNSVRKRNYPREDWPDVLYAPEGKVQLTEQELLDEWGREFFAEGRRRIDLIRFGRFSSGTWWDKTPDKDNHTEIFPIPRTALETNHNLKQNPGY